MFSLFLTSAQFSPSVVSNSLRSHELQHARLPCPSPAPGGSLKLTSSESVMPCSHLILCRPLLLLPPIPRSIRVFSNESALRIRWPKYWSFSFSNSPSKEHPRLISFRMDCLDLLAVQRTLKSLLQHHRSKASILWCSAFCIVQLSHPYMTTGKTIALTRWTFVSNLITLYCDHFLHKNYVSITYSIACYYQKSPSAPSQKKIIPIYIFILRMGLPRWH